MISRQTTGKRPYEKPRLLIIELTARRSWASASSLAPLERPDPPECAAVVPRRHPRESLPLCRMNTFSIAGLRLALDFPESEVFEELSPLFTASLPLIVSNRAR